MSSLFDCDPTQDSCLTSQGSASLMVTLCTSLMSVTMTGSRQGRAGHPLRKCEQMGVCREWKRESQRQWEPGGSARTGRRGSQAKAKREKEFLPL